MAKSSARIGVNGRDKILVVAAHPDDEVLGCGATIARHAAAGDVVEIVFMADGVGARGSKSGQGARRKAAQKAATILGAHKPHFLDFADNRMDALPLLDVVQKVEALVRRIGPRVVYTHHGGDLNIDHKITCCAVMTACRPLPGATVRAIYGFETPSSTEWSVPGQDESFRPVRHVAVVAFMEKKMAALRCYDMEMRAFPHARSYPVVEALATLRGAQAGVTAAEAFSVLRLIED
jgi:LmbE family N-acetylglucosaminyl deacetylase